MKKNFYKLLSTGFAIAICGMATAQRTSPLRPLSTNSAKAKKSSMEYTKVPEFMGIPYLTPNLTVAAGGASDRSFGPEVVIGQTFYDLQTNSSVPTRILNHGDGTLSTTWTFSNEPGTPWSDRGMAYHFFDGTSWVSNPDYQDANNITRVDAARTGFGAIGRISNVGDIIVAHQTAVDALQVNVNPNLNATQAWVSTAVTDMPLLWPRIAVGGSDGKTVHAIALTIPTGDTFGGTLFNGIDGAMVYNRSTDGGTTWSTTQLALPGIDSTIFASMSGDSYAIDAKGNTVAIVAGESNSRVMMWKSTDNGDTWDTTQIWSFPYEPWDDATITDFDEDGDVDSFLVNQVLSFDTLSQTEVIDEIISITDSVVVDTVYVVDSLTQDTTDVIDYLVYDYFTINTDTLYSTIYEIDTTVVSPGNFVLEAIDVSDGAYSILIDNNDQVHVWFGAMRMSNDSIGDGNYSYYPGTSGILYWNESFGLDSLILAADLVDDDGDQAFDVSTGYADVGATAGPVPYGSGLTLQPSSGIDANGTIYLSYSGAKEGNAYSGDDAEPSRKHIYLTKSTDGGATWIPPVDVVGDETAGFDQLKEYIFCSMAKNVNGNIHLVYQTDIFPGSGVTINNTTFHPFDLPSDIVYLSIPTDFETVGISTAKASAFNASVQPNPANEFARLKLNIEKSADVSITINNLLGQSVEHISTANLAIGEHSFALNTASIPAGIYLVTITSGSSTESLKLVVKH
jgi:hypothetical protein